MSLSHSPKIVTNGLVVCLNAADVKSYPGSGTTWFDRSGNGNHGTLAGGASYSSANGGLFNFDGVDDSINIPVNLSTITHTIIVVARYTGLGQTSRVVSSNNGNWLMGWWGGQTDKYYAEGWVSATSGGTAETNWICYAATGNQAGDSWQLYRNGVLIVGPNNAGAAGPNGIKLGGWTSSEFSACQVSYVLAYNRVLAAEEILENFNATRGRHGI